MQAYSAITASEKQNRSYSENKKYIQKAEYPNNQRRHCGSFSDEYINDFQRRNNQDKSIQVDFFRELEPRNCTANVKVKRRHADEADKGSANKNSLTKKKSKTSLKIFNCAYLKGERVDKGGCDVEASCLVPCEKTKSISNPLRKSASSIVVVNRLYKDLLKETDEKKSIPKKNFRENNLSAFCCRKKKSLKNDPPERNTRRPSPPFEKENCQYIAASANEKQIRPVFADNPTWNRPHLKSQRIQKRHCRFTVELPNEEDQLFPPNCSSLFAKYQRPPIESKTDRILREKAGKEHDQHSAVEYKIHLTCQDDESPDPSTCEDLECPRESISEKRRPPSTYQQHFENRDSPRESVSERRRPSSTYQQHSEDEDRPRQSISERRRPSSTYQQHLKPTTYQDDYSTEERTSRRRRSTTYQDDYSNEERTSCRRRSTYENENLPSQRIQELSAPTYEDESYPVESASQGKRYLNPKTCPVQRSQDLSSSTYQDEWSSEERTAQGRSWSPSTCECACHCAESTSPPKKQHLSSSTNQDEWSPAESTLQRKERSPTDERAPIYEDEYQPAKRTSEIKLDVRPATYPDEYSPSQREQDLRQPIYKDEYEPTEYTSQRPSFREGYSRPSDFNTYKKERYQGSTASAYSTISYPTEYNSQRNSLLDPANSTRSSLQEQFFLEQAPKAVSTQAPVASSTEKKNVAPLYDWEEQDNTATDKHSSENKPIPSSSVFGAPSTIDGKYIQQTPVISQSSHINYDDNVQESAFDSQNLGQLESKLSEHSLKEPNSTLPLPAIRDYKQPSLVEQLKSELLTELCCKNKNKKRGLRELQANEIQERTCIAERQNHQQHHHHHCIIDEITGRHFQNENHPPREHTSTLLQSNLSCVSLDLHSITEYNNNCENSETPSNTNIENLCEYQCQCENNLSISSSTDQSDYSRPSIATNNFEEVNCRSIAGQENTFVGCCNCCCSCSDEQTAPICSPPGIPVITKTKCNYPKPPSFAKVYDKLKTANKNSKPKNCACKCNCAGNKSNQVVKMSNETEYDQDKDCSVRVSVRIRPQNSRELIDMCRICTTVTPNEPQIVLGLDKAFTFDYVFDVNSNQGDIYEACVKRLVEGALHGYNATVLAYGQTGSGKTYTMGTGFDRNLNEQQQGIIPRAVEHIFSGIDEMQAQARCENDSSNSRNIQFSVAAQFMELYNEEIIDLLDPYNKGRMFKIHEDINGEISVTGVTIKPIYGSEDALKCLQQGALARTTASTKMNDQSSRSHALFTILIRRQRVVSSCESGLPEGDLETLTSKFHFVDLAGSERLKRTGATGERAREGISINCGLLSLGNCISALGDKSKKATHIPYRDSKLTRLLQDSLGGNSQTVMIACVSPSDRDFMETLNTLKYANRARNIKNRVQINQDQSSRTISQLRREIAALQLELLEFKQGKRLTDAEGNSSLSDTFHENSMLMCDNKRLQQRLKAMQETINKLTEKNSQLLLEKESYGWSTLAESDASVTNMIGGYLSEIEKLQAKLIESEEMYQQMKKNDVTTANTLSGIFKNKSSYEDPDDLIDMAKRELEKERLMLMSSSMPASQEDSSNCNNVINDSYDSDDSDTESDDKTNEIQADLNDINSDIEIKSKLIEQLELSQQRMQLMRQHYEEKLLVLNCKITNTQKERDEVLANMGSSNTNVSNGKVKKVRDEYERKISDMQRELKKLQQAEREHSRQQREMKAQEAKLCNLKAQLAELKCIKTRLMRKMSEQSTRHKEEDTRKAREIAQLRKEQRRQQNTVKSLQAQMHAKEQILKRKTEEVQALRRSNRGSLSLKAAGRVPPSKKDVLNSINTRLARQRWDKIFRAVSRAARNKQVVVQLEKELERLVEERENLCHDLTNIQCRAQDKSIELSNEVDTIKSNLNYVQDNIAHVQQAIMELEESKESNNEAQNLQSLIGNVRSMDEAKFLLERLTDSAILLSCNTALTQNRLLEHEALLKEAQQENGVQQQLLQHFLAQNNAARISDLFDSLNLGASKLNSHNLSGSQKSLNSNGTYDIPFEGSTYNAALHKSQHRSQSRSPSPSPTIDMSCDKSDKIRRRTAQPQELLFGDSNIADGAAMTRSYTQQETCTVNPLIRVPSAPGSLKQPSLNSPSSSVAKKNIETSLTSSTMAAAVSVAQSPRLSRRGLNVKGTSGLDDDGTFMPQSPPVYRKMTSREDTSTDVFSRLGAGIQDPVPGGNIQKVIGKIRLGAPLYCTHTVCGHNNSVLSIKVDDNILYTAAADRTVKVWDLNQERAQHCLSSHPGPVIAVQNDINSGLLFSASGPYVKVWDLRASNTKPIKTLTSSGQLQSGNVNSISGIAPGESPITALCLGGASNNLYVAASDKVRIWDLKHLTCMGKLSGGHQAAVMCVTSWSDANRSTDFVATGSKDHYVKVFEVSRTGGVIYPLLNLEPPHYDGVQALVVAKDAIGADAELFSGSRDSGIKRWDLNSGELKQSINNAHKGWVSGMAISGDILLSCCRGGIIRLWNVKNCESLAELKTDLMINDIVASGHRIFTASSDGRVRLWRFTNTLRRQCSVERS